MGQGIHIGVIAWRGDGRGIIISGLGLSEDQGSLLGFSQRVYGRSHRPWFKHQLGSIIII